METWKHGNMETWKRGIMEWWNGGMMEVPNIQSLMCFNRDQQLII